MLYICPVACAQRQEAISTTRAKSSERFDAVSQKECDDDPRLNARITVLVCSRLTVSDLTRKLSERTHVKITLDDTYQDAVKIQVCALLRDTKLSNTLNGLVALMGYRTARWYIVRGRGEDGVYTYTLVPRRRISDIVRDVKEQIRKQFVDEAGILRAALAMSPDELKAAGQNDSDAAYLVPDQNYPVVSQRAHALLGGFFSLPTEQQNQLLGGGEPVTVPVSSLPADSQKFFTEEDARNNNKGPHPLTCTFMAQTAFGLTPALFGGLSQQGLVNCIGGGLRENEWNNNIAKLWNLPEDGNLPVAAKEKVLKEPKPATQFIADFANDPDADLERLLWMVSEAAPVSILASLPFRTLPATDASQVSVVVAAPSRVVQEPPYGKTLSYLLGELDGARKLKSKWRDGILLLSNPSVPFTTSPPPMYL